MLKDDNEACFSFHPITCDRAGSRAWLPRGCCPRVIPKLWSRPIIWLFPSCLCVSDITFSMLKSQQSYSSQRCFFPIVQSPSWCRKESRGLASGFLSKQSRELTSHCTVSRKTGGWRFFSLSGTPCLVDSAVCLTNMKQHVAPSLALFRKINNFMNYGTLTSSQLLLLVQNTNLLP